MPASYHLDLDARKICGAKIALLPGDPFRSSMVSGHLVKSQGHTPPEKPLAHKREFCTYRVPFGRTSVLVTSTGIGGPSASIALDELAQLGVDTFIRVGTTGTIQTHIKVGDVIVTSASVRLDGASTHYAPIEFPAVAHHEVLQALLAGAKASCRSQKGKVHVGITVSSDTFYPGQERHDSFSGHVPRRFQGMTEEWRRLNALNYEMESATVLTLCVAWGLRAGCVSGVVVSRGRKERVSAKALRLGEERAVETAVLTVPLLIG